jgi:hypothetical protein
MNPWSLAAARRGRCGRRGRRGRRAGRDRAWYHPERREPGGDHSEARRGDQQGDGQPEVLGERAGDGGSGHPADAGAGHRSAQGRRPARRVGEPAQPGGPHRAVAGPEGEPSGEQGREAAGDGLREDRGGHQQASGQGDPPGAEPVGQRAGGHRHSQRGEPGRAEHHPLLESGQAELAGVDGHDRDERELSGRAGQDQPVDQRAEQPRSCSGPDGLRHGALLTGVRRPA